MKNLYLILITLITPFTAIGSVENIDSLLRELDNTILNKDKYEVLREERIKNFRNMLEQSYNIEHKYNLYGRLFDEYRYYNTDSAFLYAKLKSDIAENSDNSDFKFDSQMNMADILSLTGMYKESLDILESIPQNVVPSYLLPYYFHLHHTIYERMADYALRESDKARYNNRVSIYRDSLLKIKPKNSLEYSIMYSQKLMAQKEYDTAISLLKRVNDSIDINDHNRAFFAYLIAKGYKAKGDINGEIEHLAISSISDLKSAIREYVSLRELALLLYEKGDIDRAYTYLKRSMSDASICNARQRTIEISKIYSVIDEAYIKKNETQRQQTLWTLFGISALSVILIFTILFLYSQMKKLKIARAKLKNANTELSGLNNELQDVNDELNDINIKIKEANIMLSETSIIKEEYIGRYMDQCSTYLEKIESYRKSLYKIANNRNMDDLVSAIKSTRFIEDELKEFYVNFDNTFLRLFPNFVDDFNELLSENEAIRPKNGELMNTELRIYALIRLGITDSVKIAQFLRYSVTTIYNYRTRIRNKSVRKRGDFENEVMNIGQIKHI